VEREDAGVHAAAARTRADDRADGLRPETAASLPHESEFVFTTLRGSHYRPSSRSHHWNPARCAAGGASTDFYLATRHYFCW
jgi:hypothetical protein